MNILERSGTIADDLFETLAIFTGEVDADGLSHDPRLTRPTAFANLFSASMHLMEQSVNSNLKKGNRFRDLVDDVLIAAGFRTNPEARIKFKKVDNVGVWDRDEIQGPVRYLFETKDYEGTLPKEECIEFIAEYGSLLRSRDAEQAWMVSKGPISPDGKALIDNEPNMRCMTFCEFQRRLLLLEQYLHDIIGEHEQLRLNEYYVRPETIDGIDLESEVYSWLYANHNTPLFILGHYGKGKSTFALHLAAEFADAALKDANKRVPILVRLGEIVDEQSLDGLFGKVLASRYRVSNYHFQTFRTLNRLGRFLIIYDAFDEMKHGMTFPRFQVALYELMKMDEGDARIIVLGRDTALHDDVEFRLVLNGEQITTSGRFIPYPSRRPYKTLQIRGFTTDEAYFYVRHYLPIRVYELARQRAFAFDRDWTSMRIDRLLSGDFDHLLERPVHAQMLCEIAAHPQNKLSNLTVYDLYDTFVHYLLDRETKKKGRHAAFNVTVRRTFNAALAWWLWERGGASTTTLNDVPIHICKGISKEVTHELEDIALKRELVQGCLIEKASNTIYFGHRSLQEFLVAEHLINTNLLRGKTLKQSIGSDGSYMDAIMSTITPEIISFIVGGVRISKDRQAAALEWCNHLITYGGKNVSLRGGFRLFVEISKNQEVNWDVAKSPWFSWLELLRRSDGMDFTQCSDDVCFTLIKLLDNSKEKGRLAQAAAAYAFGRVILHGVPKQQHLIELFAAMVPSHALRVAVKQAKDFPDKKVIVDSDRNFLLYAFLSSANTRVYDDELHVCVDGSSLVRAAQNVLRCGFKEEKDALNRLSSYFPANHLYDAMSRFNYANETIDALHEMFSDSQIRASLIPSFVG